MRHPYGLRLMVSAVRATPLRKHHRQTLARRTELPRRTPAQQIDNRQQNNCAEKRYQ